MYIQLEISLFGDCCVKLVGSSQREIRGTKQKALIAMLATAPMGRRSRAFLQDALWGETCFDGGRQSLRRALSDMRKFFGPAFSALFLTTKSSVTLKLERVRHLTAPDAGTFLEGMDLPEEGFNEWLRAQRLRHSVLPTQGSTMLPVSNRLCPSIAILPFALVHGDRTSRHLGDWLAEDIARSLSRSHFLSVISHLSCRVLARDRTLNIETIRHRLGVDYALCGSLRIAGDRVLLDIDFLCTASGRILATRAFCGSLSRFVDLSCGMISEIVDAVGRLIVQDVVEAAAVTPIDRMAHQRLLIAGVALMHQASHASFVRGRALIERAIEVAPGDPEVHAWLGKWHVLRVINGWSDSASADAAAAHALTTKALQIRPTCDLSLTVDGFVLNNLIQDLDASGVRYRRALEINPNNSLAWLLRSMQHAFSGDGARAVEFAERAHRLSPLDPFGYFFESLRASAHWANGDDAKALALAERSIALNSRHLSTLRVKIAALHGLDRGDEARAAATELMRLQPRFTVGGYIRSHPSADFQIGRRMARALTDAGIPKQ